MKTRLVMVALVVTLCGYSFGQAPKPATTKPGATKPAAESIEQMQARLTKLKADVAELEAKIAAAKPADGTPTIDAVMSKIPEDIRYKAGENQVRRAARGSWILKNVCGDGDGRSELSYFTSSMKGTPAVMQGTIAGIEEDNGVVKMEVWQKVDVVDAEPMRIHFVLPAGKYREQAMKWGNGDTLKFTGKLVKLNMMNQECVAVDVKPIEFTPKKSVKQGAK